MRFHITSLPHTEVTKSFDWCAYTAKVRRFCSMMTARGHEVFLYAGEQNEAEVTEHIPVVTSADRLEWFGHETWPTNEVFGFWDARHPSWSNMNSRSIREISTRLEQGDFVGIIGGNCQSPLLEAFKSAATVVEWGIGYAGVISDYRVFESYAWMHHVAGLRHQDEFRPLDTVIPNSFDPEDFLPSTTPGEYLLFLGRPTVRKGQDIIRDLTKQTDYPIHTAGQGGPWLPGATHHGVVLGVEKAQLLAGARALLAPTTYLEPFGGVTIEAMMSGTPVITTDWGAFTETVQDGANGYRCRTSRDFVQAAESVEMLDRESIAVNARLAYSTDTIAHRYESYFEDLSTYAA